MFPALHSHGDVQRAASSTTRGGAASVASKSKRPRSARGLLALAPRGLRAVLFVLVVLVAVAFAEAHRIASKRPRLRAEASASATRSAASSSSSAAAASRLLRSAQRARSKEASALLARRASPRNAPSDRQMGDRVRGNIPASTGSRKVPRTDSHDTRLRISFLYCTRGEDLADGVAAVASAPRRRTLAFTECNGGRWQNASYEELLEFVDTQVALSLAVPTRDSALYTRLSPDNDEETPLYLRPCPTASQGRSLWRQAMHVWRDRSMYSVVIVVERTPPSHCAIASVDLIQLQKGAAAGRPMYETQLVLREINRTLEDDDQATANDLCHRLLHRSEILKWRRFADEAARVFGTARCHSHPGVFFCWCGMLSGATTCTSQHQANHLMDFTRFITHLKICAWSGAPTILRRLFEYQKYGGVITTALPANMPPIIVPPRFIFGFEPNVLSNGASLSQEFAFDLPRTMWFTNDVLAQATSSIFRCSC